MTEAVVSKYVTGHCAAGGHEGAPQLSPGGSLRTPCRGEYQFRLQKVLCNCWCHEMFREVRALKAAEAEPIETDAAGNEITLDPLELADPPQPLGEYLETLDCALREASKPNLFEELAQSEHLTDYLDAFLRKNGLVTGPRAAHKRYASNDTERRARGSLDVNVEAVCRLASLSLCPWDEATPTNIALMIDPLDQPSAGAIREVLIRWGKAGYAAIHDKPVKFSCFVGPAVVQTIASLSAPRDTGSFSISRELPDRMRLG